MSGQRLQGGALRTVRMGFVLATVSALCACTFETGDGFTTVAKAGVTVYSPTVFVNGRGERATFTSLRLECSSLKLMPAGSSVQTGTPGSTPTGDCTHALPCLTTPAPAAAPPVLAAPPTNDLSLLTMPIASPLLGLGAVRQELEEFLPSPVLVKGPIGSARLECQRVQGLGEIDNVFSEKVPFSVDVEILSPFEFKIPNLPVDRTTPDELQVEAILSLDRFWFAVDFQKLLGVEIVLTIDERHPLAVAAVQAGMTPSQLSVVFYPQ